MTRKVSILFGLAFAVAACESEKPAPPPPPPAPAAAPAPPAAPPPPAPGTVDPAKLAVFQPLPKEITSDANPITEEKVDLGHRLFFETGLSSGGKMACESCHVLESFGVDGLPVAKGQNGKPLKRNTPTVFNAALSSSFGWDGRSPSLEEFLKSHLAEAEVMGTTDAKVEALAKKGYAKYYAAAAPSSPKPANLDNTAAALGAYLRRLVTPGAWEKFLGGDQTALTLDQKKGLNAFFDNGCIACHAGAGVGGMLTQKLGLVKPWPAPAKGEPDLGKYESTKVDSDKWMFRSASLRNVAKTGPYLSDGSVTSLEELVKLMGAHQLGKEVTAADATAIATFLTALTGDLPTALIAKPPETK
jgi:cytochrome c peroxidase